MLLPVVRRRGTLLSASFHQGFAVLNPRTCGALALIEADAKAAGGFCVNAVNIGRTIIMAKAPAELARQTEGLRLLRCRSGFIAVYPVRRGRFLPDAAARQRDLPRGLREFSGRYSLVPGKLGTSHVIFSVFIITYCQIRCDLVWAAQGPSCHEARYMLEWSWLMKKLIARLAVRYCFHEPRARDNFQPDSGSRHRKLRRCRHVQRWLAGECRLSATRPIRLRRRLTMHSTA